MLMRRPRTRRVGYSPKEESSRIVQAGLIVTGKLFSLRLKNGHAPMQYRRLGSTGLQLSALSFGAWVTFGNQIGRDESST